MSSMMAHHCRSVRSSEFLYYASASTTPTSTSFAFFMGKISGRMFFTGSSVKNVNSVRDGGDEKLKLIWYNFLHFPTPLTGINQLYGVYNVYQSKKLEQLKASLRDIHILIEFLCKIDCRSSFPETTAQSMCWERLTVSFLHHRVLSSEFSLVNVCITTPNAQPAWIMMILRPRTKLSYQMYIVICKTTI